MIVRAVGTIAVGVLLAGCGSANKESAGTPGTTATKGTTGTTVGTSTSECQPLAGAGTAPRLSPVIQNRQTMYLTGVAAERLDCADRVVFSFRKGPPPGPGFDVSYQPAASAKIEDGSGNPIAVAGSAFLVVKLQPAATAEMVGDKLKFTYTGPRRLKLEGARHVSEIVKTGDFEAVVTWVIGLDEKRPFTGVASESQLVVDLG